MNVPPLQLTSERMGSSLPSTNETVVEKSVTYQIVIDGQLLLVENVPARVNVETGERYFAPETVERLQQVVWGQCRPVRTVQTPVYEYASLR